MFPVYLFGLLLLPLCVFTNIYGQTIVLCNSNDVVQIEQHVKAPFIVNGCAFTSDVTLSAEEFFYITNIKIGEELSEIQLAQAVKGLFQKNCFESVSIEIEDEVLGKSISFTLKGLWRFEKLKIKGVWVERDWYKQYYLMEPGDVFDLDKHRHSLQKIEEFCKKNGFFNVNIQDTLIHDEKTKTIYVYLFIQRGRRFSITKTNCTVRAEDPIPSGHIEELKQQLNKKFLRLQRFGKYSKSFLEQVAKEIKEYIAKQGFLLITIDLIEQVIHEKRAVRLNWNIIIGKKRKFVFFGAHFFSPYQLSQRILQFGRSAWIVPSSILIEELKNMYTTKGFWKVKINASDEEDRVVFAIAEGKRSIIKEIEFQGVNQVAKQLLMKHCFKQFRRGMFFDQQLLDTTFEKIIDYYNTRGFAEAKIVHHQFVEIKDNFYTLVLSIDEGNQSHIDTVAIPSFEHLLNEGPFYKSKKIAGYTVFDVQKQKQWLINKFRQEGYLFASIESEIEPLVDNKKLLLWRITPGQQIHFGKTFIQGSSSLPFHVVMRELCYKEGDIWNVQKVYQSLMRLKSNQIFDVISFVPLSIEKQTNRSMLLKFHKDDPFELRARIGLEFQHIQQYQTFGGVTYKVGGTFLVKNPSNNGDYFRFDADVARSHRELHFTYFYPWLFNLPINGIFRVYGIRYEQPGFIGNANNIYTNFEHGALVGIHYKNEYIDTGINGGFEVSRTKVGDDITTKSLALALARAMDFNPQLLKKQIPFFLIEPTFLINYLDNSVNPSKGMLTLISVKGMFPASHRYAQSYFLKLLVEHSWFVPIQRAVAAFRVRFGHIFHRCFADILPNERFYLGGAYSVRGYEADLAPPLGCFYDDRGKKNIVPRGGKTMMNLNLELRLPLMNKVGFVLFQDFGVLSGDAFLDFQKRNFVGGSGFGIRYLTPIGPMRFDVAWKWKKQFPQERNFNWYLTLGQAF